MPQNTITNIIQSIQKQIIFDQTSNRHQNNTIYTITIISYHTILATTIYINIIIITHYSIYY